MRISVKILSALLLIFVILFNTVSCDLVESFLGDTDGIVNPSGGNDQTGDGTGDDPYANFGKEYPCISVERALEIAYDAHTETTEKYYVVATITDIESLKNGHMTVSDDTGSILVYRSTDKNGSKLTNSGLAVGDVVIVYGTLYNYSGYTPEFKSAKILDWYTPGSNISPDSSDPYADVDLTSFYDNYTPATSYEDAYYRTKHGLLSGTLADQDQAPTISTYQPMQDGKFVRNNSYLFSEDKNTYYVVDAYGNVVMEIYKGGAYIMLEEVAAYVFAFGEPPVNQTSSKDSSPSSSKWGRFLRLNHTYFSCDTQKYPYEPLLPNLSYVKYYEMDIGTTGTDCDPSYTSALYNNGSRIVRGAARIVYTYTDKNGNRIIDLDERFVFYTYNHYNDFQEYLNYYGGWGEMFGNITGGGKISSTTNYNPSPYVQVVHASLTSQTATVIYYYVPKDEYACA